MCPGCEDVEAFPFDPPDMPAGALRAGGHLHRVEPLLFSTRTTSRLYPLTCQGAPTPLAPRATSTLTFQLLGEADENSFRTADVAEPVDVFVVDDFIDHRRAELAQPRQGVVKVLDGEHDPQVSK